MIFVETLTTEELDSLPAPEVDIDMSDEQYAEYLEIEREIDEEHRAEQRKRLYKLLAKLDVVNPEIALVMRESVKPGATDKKIADLFRCHNHVARRMRRYGTKVLWEMAHPQTIIMSLFGFQDYPATVRKPYKQKRPKQKV